MNLSTLIDLEAQLQRDREIDPGALALRDASLAGGHPDPRRPHAAVEAWVRGLREREEGGLLPGRSLARALRLVRAVLAVAGLLLGWGAAAALLRFDGPHPVNVWDLLLALVGLQIVLLVLLLASLFFPVSSIGLPLLGLFRGLAAWAYPRLAARGLAPERLREWRLLLHRLRSRRSLYRRVEPWLLLGLTQAFGVAFNVGAILALLRHVVFTDVAFAWSTTLLDLDPARFHAVVRVLSAPWAALWPDAVPTPELVAATRYSRLEGAYFLSGTGRAADPALVGGWWPFLLASVATYGLVPRVVALAGARLRAWSVLARLPLDDAEVRALLGRIAGGRVETASPDPEAPGPPPPPAPLPAAPGSGTPARLALVVWRDAPSGDGSLAAVARQVGAAPAEVLRAGGVGHEEGEAGLGRIAAGGADAVAVLAEAWEAPDGGALRLLRSLRGGLGPGRRVLVLLRGEAGAPRPEELRVWREELARLEDPWLAVEPLREGP
ncbi:MAG TPA: DUF2868 domain-containing protein [Anaeromyxobacteraceae bacterium]|nr:DUF2868 domain-containing protein [Anaeromyxobacteraceae bacterium]